jgi:predicted  nucleic acid-binding Zn-ribbon protein
VKKERDSAKRDWYIVKSEMDIIKAERAELQGLVQAKVKRNRKLEKNVSSQSGVFHLVSTGFLFTTLKRTKMQTAILTYGFSLNLYLNHQVTELEMKNRSIEKERDSVKMERDSAKRDLTIAYTDLNKIKEERKALQDRLQTAEKRRSDAEEESRAVVGGLFILIVVGLFLVRYYWLPIWLSLFL